MRLALLAASLYAAVLAGATPAAALDPGARAGLEAARRGEMARLVFHEAPKPPVEAVFADAEGRERRLTDWPGKVVFVNFWATWCPPCLKEMPSIDRLAAAMEGPDFEVVAISTDRGDVAKPRDWLAANGIARLELYHDGRFRTAQAAGLLGQPTTLILDREGREIARFTGDAEWDSPDALAILRAIVEATAAGG
jgi:thiol-disulfide isomerase/thioredoxin